jgi:pilus assembly protein CpaF
MSDTDVTKILPKVRAHILEQAVPIPGWRAPARERHVFHAAVAQALVELRLDRRLDGRLTQAAERLAGMMTGLGILQRLLEADGVEEIVVRDGFVQVERHGTIEDVGRLADDAHFEQVARRAADLGQRTMKGDRPFVLVDLPDGSRFTAIVPPLSVRGASINVRVFARERLSLGDLSDLGSFDAPDEPGGEGVAQDGSGERLKLLPPVARLLAQVAAGNLATTLISGRFGAGKTTLMNAMSLHVPNRIQLAVVETFRELRIAHPHPLRVVVSEDRPGAPTMDEVLNVVVTRMRPDLLIIGEIVRGEAPRFLDAMNLGIKAWSTIHGNDCLGALYRLERMARRGADVGETAVRERIAAGVELVVHLGRDACSGRRYVSQVVLVKGLDFGGRYDLETLYDAQEMGSIDRLGLLWEEVSL